MVTSAGIPVIKISYSHPDDEFESADDLRTWIMTALKARDGLYLTGSFKRWGNMPPGSIVLFRKGDEIVGEGVIKESPRVAQGPSTYDGVIKFEVSSLRIYRGSLKVSGIETLLDKKLPPQATPIISWDEYGKLLSEIVKNGFI